MEIKRLFVAIILSALLLFGFEYFIPSQTQKNVQKDIAQTSKNIPAGFNQAAVNKAPMAGLSSQPVSTPSPESESRIPIEGDRVKGTIDLRGAKLDDLLLTDYHETVKDNSPLVRVLSSFHGKQPNYVEIGWVRGAGDTTKLPDEHTLWKTSGTKLTPTTPLILTWDNGEGVEFEIKLLLDHNFMFTVNQTVKNTTAKPITLFPYSRVSRGYTPVETGGYLVHEGPVGVIDGRLQEESYKNLRKNATPPTNIAWNKQAMGGWSGITDKYWLTAVIPYQKDRVTTIYGYVPNEGAGTYKVGYTYQAPVTVSAGGSEQTKSYVFSGAKEVHLLESYEKSLNIPSFWKAVDFGWFAFMTRPIFFVLDWLNTVLGNFGLALMAFTLIVKAIFYPLASKQYHSMGRMKDLQPKMKSIRERFKDDPTAMNREVMMLYKKEGVNPASGCLPMLVQIPVFWSLYKDLYVTIEMRHAPFFGWIRDLSAPDPTNVFNLFGLIPWDPTTISPMLHLGVWGILFGITMFFQQKLNPAPVDPVQQRMFQIMPLVFTFILASQPAGLVIYYCWNNFLSILQQKLIMHRSTKRKGLVTTEKN
ncbi:membrane protein insertase YidC [Entomobacter blattae]|uniref:Membrane protein insertase YidC n=1 Tax=Entomobacter blattae TaxID=2762277 RepID=A0A7H1NSM2_9PROT|nr:membrane protein insertase YidC [Entomobacter blattae]QNT78782.1 Membrane protein insertase YidC [Entomobacter blattae]